MQNEKPIASIAKNSKISKNLTLIELVFNKIKLNLFKEFILNRN